MSNIVSCKEKLLVNLWFSVKCLTIFIWKFNTYSYFQTFYFLFFSLKFIFLKYS